MDIINDLKKLSDEEYREFSSKLTPNLKKENIIGVRIPEIRKYAKTIKDNCNEFLNDLPHTYYDENILHGCLISEIKDYDKCLEEINKFLPYVDNWAVCDTMTPKVFKKNADKLIVEINKWLKSKHTYTIRYAIRMLMCFYLDENFKEEYLYIPIKIKSEEYYVNMMIAWYYATALAKQPKDTMKIIESKKLSPWIQNKTIQKAKESYRITKEQKDYLNTLKV